MDFGGKTVALDFDGVLCTYESGWTGPTPTDPPNVGALDFVRRLIAANAKVIIFSTRASDAEGYAGIVNWLKLHKFPVLEVTPSKPAAIAYVDDRAVTFRRYSSGVCNWDDCFGQIGDLASVRPHGAPA